ncbi:uncharacterized protein DS421_12g366490 [Arachis hypogaea]|nr:uncharacterized protein DS421_12g366490 [Arachis hypogaea]
MTSFSSHPSVSQSRHSLIFLTVALALKLSRLRSCSQARRRSVSRQRLAVSARLPCARRRRRQKQQASGLVVVVVFLLRASPFSSTSPSVAGPRFAQVIGCTEAELTRHLCEELSKGSFYILFLCAEDSLELLIKDPTHGLHGFKHPRDLCLCQFCWCSSLVVFCNRYFGLFFCSSSMLRISESYSDECQFLSPTSLPL